MFRDEEEAKEEDDRKIRNIFHIKKLRKTVYVYEEDDKIKHASVVNSNSAFRSIRTIGTSLAWDIDAEEKALQKLKGMLTEHAYKCYVLTGSFVETSKRSNLVYVFRKLKPTIALSQLLFMSSSYLVL